MEFIFAFTIASVVNIISLWYLSDSISVNLVMEFLGRNFGGSLLIFLTALFINKKEAPISPFTFCVFLTIYGFSFFSDELETTIYGIIAWLIVIKAIFLLVRKIYVKLSTQRREKDQTL